MKKIVSSVLLMFLLSINFLAISSVVAQPSEKLPVIIRFNGKTDAALIRAQGGDIKYEYTIISAIACSLPEQAIDALTRNPNIEKIEPDGIVYAIGQITDWGVTQIGADLVHEQENTGAGVKVAIIDTGIDYNHPDLDANYKGGYDYVNDDEFPMDDDGHGTHCAGIVAAEDNEIGVIGVAPGALLYAVKVLDDTGSGYVSDVIAGIDWSVVNGMQIISMSLGADSDNELLHEACDAAYTEGVLVVAAAGNDYQRRGRAEFDTVDYPARYDSVIAVGATDDEDAKASFSSTGSALELAAPGVSIYSTFWDDTYATWGGTSMACPHVVGTAALVWAAEPSLTNVQVRVRLQETAYDLGSAGWDSWYGYGLVNAYEAVGAPIEDDTTPPVISNVEVSEVTSSSATITWTTDEPSDSQVNYGTSTSLGSGKSDNNLVTSHSVTLSELTSETNYYFEVQSTDASGNPATDNSGGFYYTFTTLEPDTTPEIFASIIEVTYDIRTAGRNRFYWATATVKVTADQDGLLLLAGATVDGHWESATSDSDVGITNDEGTVTLTSDSVKNPPTETTFTFVIDDVVLSGYIYDITDPKTTGSVTISPP